MNLSDCVTHVDADALGDVWGRAVLSADGKYRYLLERRLGTVGGRACLFVMLNPSTADAFIDDPTIRRCKAFALREGCDHLFVANLFAYRSTDPAGLLTATDPIGPHADRYLLDACQRVSLVIAAWGAHPKAAARGERVSRLLGGNLVALGTTASGAPRHPLYVRGDTPLAPWPTGGQR